MWAFVLSLALAAPGTIRGQVTIQKKDGQDKRDYSEVVVYVADYEEPVRAEVQIVQRNREYVPRVLPVAVGTEVSFPNADEIEHNVFSHSAIADFDLGRFGKGRSKAVRFEKVGVAEIFCNVHKNMVAYVVVAPNPAFAVTRADGAFELRGVPLGRHRLAIWERFAKPRLQEIEVDVATGGIARIAPIAIREQSESDPPHKNKFGTDYTKTW